MERNCDAHECAQKVTRFVPTCESQARLILQQCDMCNKLTRTCNGTRCEVRYIFISEETCFCSATAALEKERERRSQFPNNACQHKLVEIHTN
jgi:hypothetical protein